MSSAHRSLGWCVLLVVVCGLVMRAARPTEHETPVPSSSHPSTAMATASPPATLDRRNAVLYKGDVHCAIYQRGRTYIFGADVESNAWEFVAQSPSQLPARYSGHYAQPVMAQLRNDLLKCIAEENGVCEEAFGPTIMYQLDVDGKNCQLAVRADQLTPRRRAFLQRLDASLMGELLRRAGWIPETEPNRSPPSRTGHFAPPPFFPSAGKPVPNRASFFVDR